MCSYSTETLPLQLLDRVKLLNSWKGGHVEVMLISSSLNTISLRDTKRSIVVRQSNLFHTELMVEIYSKSLIRAIGEVLLIKFS